MGLDFLNTYEKEHQAQEQLRQAAESFAATLKERLSERRLILQNSPFRQTVNALINEIEHRTGWTFQQTEIESRHAVIDLKTHTPIFEHFALTGQRNPVFEAIQRQAEYLTDTVLHHRETTLIYGVPEVGWQFQSEQSSIHLEIIGDFDGYEVRWWQTTFGEPEYRLRDSRRFDPLTLSKADVEDWFERWFDLHTGGPEQRQNRRRIALKGLFFILILAMLTGGAYWWTAGFTRYPKLPAKWSPLWTWHHKTQPVLMTITTTHLRSGPGTQYPAVTPLPAKTPLLPVGHLPPENGWVAVKYQKADGFWLQGWVPQSILQPQKQD
ncbi:MAG: hypothetical protein D6675_03670 [Gemmatimonadetes bacterium]|nr:MAG: hypothetical protein D6675_03670 [Gemmatimonadota bacterium]